MIKNLSKYFAFFVFCVLLTYNVLGQSQNLVYRTNLNSFIESPAYSKKDGFKYNSDEFYTHPDFGQLTFQAPLDKRVVEDLSKRKEDERYYIDLDDPNFFYIEKSSTPINFMKDGYWRAIDYSLKPNGAGNYVAEQQPNPTALNLALKSTSISIQNKLIRNNNYALKLTSFDDAVQVIEADWSSIQVTNFDAYITDIFPNIDLQIKFIEGAIKSDFIIKQNLGVKSIEFLDNFYLPEGVAVLIDEYTPLNRNFVQFYTIENGENIALIHPALTHDASGNRNSWISEYSLDGSILSIHCDSAKINDPSIQYPITVDPLFTAVGPIAGAGSGSRLSPLFCTNNIIVNYPGGSTPWDVSLSWNVLANFCARTLILFSVIDDCFMSDAELWFTSSCGGASPTGAPGIIWGCNPAIPACNFPGNWNPTLGFGADPSTMSLVQCYTPSCANQNLTFTSNIDRLYCNPYTIYDNCVLANSYCITLNAWSVTVQGRSVETLGNTATGNGTQNIYDADCIGTQNLDPTPLYGVGGYTYNWSHGPTSPTVTVPGTVSTYTCVVTDACGTAVTATFDIGCPLSLDLKQFEAQKFNNKIELNLDLGSEEGITAMKFEKSIDGTNWKELANRTPTGLLNYNVADNSPVNGNNLYRVKFYKSDSTTANTEVISLEFEYAYSIYPNPSFDFINIKTETMIGQNTLAIIQDMTGREIMRIELTNQLTGVDISELKAGNYLLLISTDGEMLQTERLSIIR